MLAAATVHFPYMTGWPERASSEDREATRVGFKRMGDAFRAAKVETIIAFTSEHIVNLEPRLVPPFLIGVGEKHETFPEPHFNLVPVTRPGNPDLALSLVRNLYNQDFDIACSSEMQLDHGTSLPLALLDIEPDVAIIPVIINSIFPPLPTLSRCRALGAAVSRALVQLGADRRVGILATGGISHIVGAPGVEKNDPDFDADFLKAIREGDLDRACSYSDERLDSSGNGTHEIRNWIAAASALFPRRPSVVTAIPYAEGWDSGVHQFLWEEA